jgi:hypothetical protein
MKYTLIVTMDPEKAPAAGSPEQGQFFGAFFAFNKEIEEKGAYLAGEPLQPVETATTVRMTEGKLSLTDGPFAETKEQIGGFYLVECSDLDEAIEWASRVPVVTFDCGAIEVRPCMDYSAAMDQA